MASLVATAKGVSAAAVWFAATEVLAAAASLVALDALVAVAGSAAMVAPDLVVLSAGFVAGMADNTHLVASLVARDGFVSVASVIHSVCWVALAVDKYKDSPE
ncbi:hypothetical protein SB782_10075 [Brevibacillus sp. SIMBA_076]